METTRANTPEARPIDPVDITTRMLCHGLLENIGELVEKRPYEVALIEKLGDDIFAVYDKGTVIRILQIPRRYHEQFRKFCVKIKENSRCVFGINRPDGRWGTRPYGIWRQFSRVYVLRTSRHVRVEVWVCKYICIDIDVKHNKNVIIYIISLTVSET